VKIFITKGGHRYSLYRMERSADNQIISGMFAPFGNLLGSAIKGLADVHVSYPTDGNLHHTMQLSDGQSARGYWDRIVFRPSGMEIPRTPDMPLFNLLPMQRLPALSDYEHAPHFYQIASSMFNLGETPYFVSENASKSKPGNKDIVIDAEVYEWINMLGFLVGKGSKFKYQPPPGTQEVLEHRIDTDAYPHIHTVVLGTNKSS
jgi:hypothetical protein